jgi:hypothetical protein
MELAEKRFDLGAVNKIKKLVQETKFRSPFGSKVRYCFFRSALIMEKLVNQANIPSFNLIKTNKRP